MENLLKLISECRQKMIKLAEEYGFTSEHTIKCSQQLDELLNQLMREEQKMVCKERC